MHLLDELERRRVRYVLPDGSRLMECGGFKGRSREMPRPELYARLEGALGIPMEIMLNQYGMTELGSQFYDSVLLQPAELRRKLGPPWARVLIVDPETGEPAAPGEVGTIVVFDLANTGSRVRLCRRRTSGAPSRTASRCSGASPVPRSAAARSPPTSC